MAIQIGLLILTITAAVVLFSIDQFRADVIALGLLLTLSLTGLIPPRETSAGFGSDTAVMIFGLLVMTAAVTRTHPPPVGLLLPDYAADTANVQTGRRSARAAHRPPDCLAPRAQSENLCGHGRRQRELLVHHPLEPACLIVYGPGHYKFLDFTKVGALLTVIVYIVSVLLVPLFWPLTLRTSMLVIRDDRHPG